MLKLKDKIRVGITMGDPSGIGPSIIAKALDKIDAEAEFVVIGDKWVFERNRKSLSGQQVGKIKNQNFKFIDLNNVTQKKFAFGKIRAEYGKAAIEYLDVALELIKNKDIDCLVTAPISKESIGLAGFNYVGLTEYFAQRTHAKDTVMMLLNRQLKFSLVTRHIALRNVSVALKKDKLYKTVYITYQALKDLFSIKNPRIVVCGVNPHASDNGLIGNEENRIIKPVLNRLKRLIRHIAGPLPADVAISKANRKVYDCIIAMYHDQALIPLKLFGNQTGVNLTLGLPFIRTSPLHGTAFDIAANFSLANPASLIEAIRLAVKCTLNLKRA